MFETIISMLEDHNYRLNFLAQKSKTISHIFICLPAMIWTFLQSQSLRSR